MSSPLSPRFPSRRFKLHAVDRGKDLFHPALGVEFVERGKAEGVQKDLRGPPDPFAAGPEARRTSGGPAALQRLDGSGYAEVSRDSR